MQREDKLIKNLQKDIKNLELRIDDKRIDRLKKLCKVGFVLNHIMPFVISSFISVLISSKINMSPFCYEKVKEYANIRLIKTSSGFENKKESYGADSLEESFLYTTDCQLNDNSLYERNVTMYKMNDSIDEDNIDEMLKLSKEELEETFDIIDIQKIQKNNLTLEDEMYSEDMVIIEINTEDKDKYIKRNETFIENLIDVSGCIGIIILVGAIIEKIDKKFLKISNKLKKYQEHLTSLQDYDTDELKKVLIIKKQNLELLTTEEEITSPKVYTYRREDK